MKASITLEIDTEGLAKLLTDPPRSIVPSEGTFTVPVGRVLQFGGPYEAEDSDLKNFSH